MIRRHNGTGKFFMTFIPFDLEYTQSVWEQKVDINLTESGVHPIRLDHLLGDDGDKITDLLPPRSTTRTSTAIRSSVNTLLRCMKALALKMYS